MTSTKKIQTASAIGLYASIVLGAAVIVFNYQSKYRFYMYNNEMYKQLMIVGAVLAVADIALILLRLRKQIPRIRQSEEGVEYKMQRYASLVSGTFYGTLFIVAAECAIIVLSNNRELIMLVLLLVLMLFLSYPNMYKIKVDLGLSDDEMSNLYGDKYIREQSQWDERPIACVELGKTEPETIDNEAEDKDGETDNQ